MASASCGAHHSSGLRLWHSTMWTVSLFRSFSHPSASRLRSAYCSRGVIKGAGVNTRSQSTIGLKTVALTYVDCVPLQKLFPPFSISFAERILQPRSHQRSRCQYQVTEHTLLPTSPITNLLSVF